MEQTQKSVANAWGAENWITGFTEGEGADGRWDRVIIWIKRVECLLK